MKKHMDAKSRTDSLSVGGGVSLWPEMERMRLTQEEGAGLVLVAFSLIVITFCAFYGIHGESILARGR